MTLFELLALGAPSGTEQDPKAGIVNMIGMFAIMGVMFYFLLIRPQQKQKKEQENLLNNLKSGDKVLTSAGIFGIVANVKDKVVLVKIADNVKVEFSKSAITSVVQKSEEGGGEEKK